MRDRLTLLRANEPLDLVMLDSMRVLFQNELWDRGFGDAVVDTTVVVDTATRLADVRLTLIAEPAHDGRTTSPSPATNASTKRRFGTRSRSGPAICIGSPTMLESQRNLYESNLFRLAAIYVAAAARQREEREHRRHRGAAARSADGPGSQQCRLLAVPGALHGLQPVRRRATARRRRHGGQSVRAARSRGAAFSATSRADVPDRDVSPFLQPTYNASIDFKQPAFLQRPNGRRRRSACSRIAASTPACSSTAATAARRRSRIKFRPALR